jgi:pyruvate dehydrogenase E1 component alpha subunit
MNMAVLWTLPVIFVCENNLYNEYTHHSETTSGGMQARPEAFGMRAEEVDGQDVRAVHGAAARAVAAARAGEGPSFILCQTYRYRGHHVGDVDRTYYRTRDEEESWQSERDPLTRLGVWLVDEGLATPERLEQLAHEAEEEVRAGVEFALDADFPDPSEVDQDVYA